MENVREGMGQNGDVVGYVREGCGVEWGCSGICEVRIWGCSGNCGGRV